jgi:peptidoglycan/LPS O-acetylase OafA/YrhL
MIYHVFFKPIWTVKPENIVTIVRFLWACSIGWTIFACQQLKSGGVIRTFLSHRMWQPIAKLSLSIYLVHFIFLSTVEMDPIQPKDGFMFQHIVLISAGDMLMSLFLGIFFYIFVEAPISNLIMMIPDRKQMKNADIEAFERKPLLNEKC